MRIYTITITHILHFMSFHDMSVHISIHLAVISRLDLSILAQKGRAISPSGLMSDTKRSGIWRCLLSLILNPS